MKNDILKSLNERQIEAVKATEGPVLIVAGPGSGKTRVLTHRVAYLISQGVTPVNILAVTFTNKAAQEMRERINKLAKSQNSSFKQKNLILNLRQKADDKGPTIGTFHAVCAKILRQEARHLGYTGSFIIYDDKDSLNLIKQIMKDLLISEEQFKPQGIQGVISKAKNELVDVSNFKNQAFEYYQITAAKIYEEYQNRLKKANAFDFDDLIMMTVKLFRENPEVLEKYQKKFKYIMVDEWQDTNHSQYILINLLAQKN